MDSRLKVLARDRAYIAPIRKSGKKWRLHCLVSPPFNRLFTFCPFKHNEDNFISSEISALFIHSNRDRKWVRTHVPVLPRLTPITKSPLVSLAPLRRHKHNLFSQVSNNFATFFVTRNH
jgi:hypothetical protein